MRCARPQQQAETCSWLARWQAGFGAMLRTPLDRSTGQLRAQPERYPAGVTASALPGPLTAVAERLAVYNRQYWFRLLSVLHNELPLTSRLCGLWHFNQLGLDFLREHPPRHPDLRRVTDGFETHLASALREPSVRFDPGSRELPRAALLQAAQLDLACARVFAAPETAPLELARLPAAALPELRLSASPAYARFSETWPLVALRHALAGDAGEDAVPLPAAHETPRQWAIFRNPQGVMHAPLAPAQARLYALLEELPLGAALGQLEQEAHPALRAELPELTRGWLELAARHFFCAAH